MRNFFSGLMFIVLVIASLPITSLAFLLYALRGYYYSRKYHTSLTAYNPLEKRYFYHKTGSRPDLLTAQLFPHLPATTSWSLFLSYGIILLAVRLSGYLPESLRYPAANSSSLGNIVALRTQFFDKALQKYTKSVSQVVFLGAGWDTRSLVLARRKKLRVFEVDTPEMQQTKLASLAKAKIATAKVKFVAVNFEQEAWLEKLEEQGFDKTKSTFFLLEGVVYYLQPATVIALLRQFSAQFSPQNILAFDYPARQLVNGRREFCVLSKLIQVVLKLSRERWHFGISTSVSAEKQAKHFLNTYDLRLIKHQVWGTESSTKSAYGGIILASPQVKDASDR